MSVERIDTDGTDPRRIRRALQHINRQFVSVDEDVSGKADKVSGATAGNLAGLDASGNLTDSGSDPTDFAAASHTHDAGDIDSGTLDDARVAESNVTQHEGAIDHDALTGFVADEHRDIGSGLLSARPAAGTAGNLYVSTDEPALYYDNGAAWEQVGGTECGYPILDEASDVILTEDGDWIYSESCS